MTIHTTNFNFSSSQKKYQGKVRDTYAVGKNLISISTNRLSAFDVVFPQTIPHKGAVLNGISKYFFEELKKERNSFIELGIDFEEKAFYDILKSIYRTFSNDLLSPDLESIDLESMVLIQVIPSRSMSFTRFVRIFPEPASTKFLIPDS